MMTKQVANFLSGFILLLMTAFSFHSNESPAHSSQIDFSQDEYNVISYPSVPASEAANLVCYMQTRGGTTLDLGRLCRDSLRQQPQIIVSEVAFDENKLSGKVVNRSSKTISTVKVHYETFDDYQRVLQRSAVFTEPRTLKPGQSATFQNSVPNARALNILFVEGKAIAEK